MQDDKDPAGSPAARPTEVTWADGAGRQPYANRGEKETSTTDPAEIHPGGDRGAHSGVNVEQEAEARRVPERDSARVPDGEAGEPGTP
jgi:hypothetical protein